MQIVIAGQVFDTSVIPVLIRMTEGDLKALNIDSPMEDFFQFPPDWPTDIAKQTYSHYTRLLERYMSMMRSEDGNSKQLICPRCHAVMEYPWPRVCPTCNLGFTDDDSPS